MKWFKNWLMIPAISKYLIDIHFIIRIHWNWVLKYSKKVFFFIDFFLFFTIANCKSQINLLFTHYNKLYICFEDNFSKITKIQGVWILISKSCYHPLYFNEKSKKTNIIQKESTTLTNHKTAVFSQKSCELNEINIYFHKSKWI